jgi:hypothetical protein
MKEMAKENETLRMRNGQLMIENSELGKKGE